MNEQPTKLIWAISALAAIPFLIAVDSAVALARGWQTRSRLDWIVLLSAVFALISIGLVAVLERGRQLLAKRSVQLVACSLVSVLAWMAMEFLLGNFASSSAAAISHLRQPHLVSVSRPTPDVFPGVTGESRFTVNSLGIRGPELPPRESGYRILCIGGSTTECAYLDDFEAWPQLVMNDLNERAHIACVWVGNVGMSGFGTVDHLAFLSQDCLWRQMDSIVFLIGANDLIRYLRFGIALQSPSDEFWQRQREAQSLEPIWKRSAALEVIRAACRRWSHPGYSVEDDMGRNYIVRRRMRQQAHIRTDFPDLTEPLHQYEQRINRLISDCRAAHVRPVFLTQPTLCSDHVSNEISNLFWLGDDGRGNYFSADAFRKGLDQYNDRLREVCGREHVECIDLAPISDHPEYFYDEFHFSEAGARQVAQLVAAALPVPSKDGRQRN